MTKFLIVAKDDSHAEDIVHIVREVFGKGNDFCKKITYQSKSAETGKAAKGEELSQLFRTSLQLRIAVMVDMIATFRLLYTCHLKLRTIYLSSIYKLVAPTSAPLE